jgi:hypothetical protein
MIDVPYDISISEHTDNGLRPGRVLVFHYHSHGAIAVFPNVDELSCESSSFALVLSEALYPVLINILAVEVFFCYATILFRRHKMTRLRQLAERYMSGGIDFQSFRRAFAMDYLATGNTNSALWVLTVQIESECDDFEQGLISELQLKANIVAKCMAETGVLSVLQVCAVGAMACSVTSQSATTLAAEAAGKVAQLPGVTLSWAYA